MILNSPTISGSLTVTGNIITSGSITISGSIASASYASNADLLDGLDSTVFTLTSSFNTTSASLYSTSASLSATSGSLSTASGSFNTRVTALEATGSALSSSLLTVSGSGYATSASLSTDSGSFNSRVATIESKYATTGSNNFRAPQYVSDTTVPTGFSNTTGSIYTDGGIQVTKDSYFSGSMFIKGNLTIYGTQSVAYITSSQLNIATNLITVNTATPAVRFGGLAVYDSGSTGTGATGSLLWDSQNNGWVYQRESGSTYAGGMLISGPRRALGSNLGDEQGLTACMIPVAQGGDHITSSLIYHDSSVTCIQTAVIGTSTACFAGVVCSNGNVLIGGSGTANYLPKFTGASTIGNSLISDDGTTVSIQRTAGDLELSLLAGSTTVAGNSILGLYAGTGAGNLVPYGTIKVIPETAATNTRAANMLFSTRNSAGTLTESFRIFSTQNVGIGTGASDSGYKLDVNGTGRFSGDLRITNNNWLVYTDSTATARNILTLASNDNLYLQYKAGSNFYLRNTDGDLRLTIASTGAATFSASSGNTVTINGVAGSFATRVNGSSTTGSSYGIGIFAGTNSSDDAFRVHSYSGTEYFRVRGDGNVGIGETSPASKLSIGGIQGSTIGSNVALLVGNNGAAGTVGNMIQIGLHYNPAGATPASVIGAVFTSTTGYTKSDIFFATRDVTTDTAPTERMRITSGGNVLIGTTCLYNGANFVVSAGSGASSSPYMGIFNCTASPTADASVRLDLGFLGGASNYVATGGCLGFINFMGQGNDAGYGGPGILAVITCGGNTCRYNHAVDMVFTSKPTGNTGSPERMRITSGGTVQMGMMGLNTDKDYTRYGASTKVVDNAAVNLATMFPNVTIASALVGLKITAYAYSGGNQGTFEWLAVRAYNVDTWTTCLIGSATTGITPTISFGGTNAAPTVTISSATYITAKYEIFSR